VSLTEFDYILITVKACPICNSRTIKKRKKGYYCGKCRITFSQPALKHVEDNRNNLPVPLYLRGKEITTKQKIKNQSTKTHTNGEKEWN
jgi:tRNA(Ile2) C34 agmatinyltransferase TiaS